MNQAWTAILPAFLRKRLEERENLQKILSNTGWLFADKILRMGVGLFVGVWVTRYLGPEKFGLLSYATAFASLFATIASLGLDGVVVRDIVRNPSHKDEILGTAFLLRAAGGLVMLPLTVGSVILVRPDDTLVIWLVGIVAAGTLFQAFDVIDFWFQSQITARYTVYARNTAFLLLAMVKVILLVYKAPLIAFALASLAEIVVGTAGLITVYTRYGLNIRNWTAKFARSKSLLKDSWPLILAGAVIAIYMKIDQIMLGNMIGDRSVGIYSAAISISEIWYALPSIIVISVYPYFVKIRQINENEYLYKLQYLYNFLVRTAIIISIITSLASSVIIETLYGNKYSAAANVLAIHVWGTIFIFHGMAKSIFVQCENMQFYNLICTAIPALLNIILNLLLIKKLGVEGAAIATVISQFIAASVIPLFNKRDRVNVIMLFKAIAFKTNKEPTANA